MLFYPILRHLVAQRAEHRVKTFFCLLHDRQGDPFIVAVHHIVARLKASSQTSSSVIILASNAVLITRFGEPSANSV